MPLQDNKGNESLEPYGGCWMCALPQNQIQKPEQISVDKKNSHNQEDEKLHLHLEDNRQVVW